YLCIELFDSNVLHIAEFMTVAKSLPHLWQKVRKLLIPKLFLSYSCILPKNSPAFSKRPRGFAARKTRKDVIHKERFSFP
ncbi:MAG: hypothetical protein MR321_04450, partial [Bacteroides sp.]|nr:hypothetical protein [Bacteroides sp.]